MRAMRSGLGRMLLLLVFFTLGPVLSYGQEEVPPVPGGMAQAPPPPPPGLPIDDYLPLLLIAGIIYGCYRSFKRAKA